MSERKRWLCPACGGAGLPCWVCRGFDPDVLAAFTDDPRKEAFADEVVSLWSRLIEERHESEHAVTTEEWANFMRLRARLDQFVREVEWAIDPEREPIWSRRERPGLPPLAAVKEALRVLSLDYTPPAQTPPMEVIREHFKGQNSKEAKHG